MTQETATIVVYTQKECSYSDALTSEMDDEGVEYTKIDIDDVPGAKDELLKLSNGEPITPVMLKGDEVIIGYHGLG
ncbi:MAG: glutaredoxin family protein [Chloroflexi bacterium]|nr:glutaredoxin family protein [Chloroflexota bacterium]